MHTTSYMLNEEYFPLEKMGGKFDWWLGFQDSSFKYKKDWIRESAATDSRMSSITTSKW